MTKLSFAIPGDLATPTGGYAYDRQVMALLPQHGIEVAHLLLPGGFPFPSEEEVLETARLLASVADDTVLLVDGLASGALPAECFAELSAPVVVMLHHPLGLETGLDEAASRKLLATEKAALGFARHIIVTSRTTAATLIELGFAPPPPVTIAEPGTERAPRAAGSGESGCQILSIGSVVPRKGHDLLVEALSRLTHLDWQCTIAGSLDRDGDFAGPLVRRVEAGELRDRIRFAGVLPGETLPALYAAADIFAMPSRYEGYGMVFAEALARGLPVVAARAGAVPDTVPPEAGILVLSEDVDALTEALASLITDRALRQKLSDAAWAHAETLPRWDDTAKIIAKVVKEVSA
ncbi:MULTISPECIES: glycosyltransferase family 4 protein [Rhodomicrobium]|uniref:glycosyltransferase family 4 protein n=1 Tax=Rhodomicrobium TaxID=1068 RepID=UPI000B4A8F17|nr:MULTISPECIES: glycosyltransferase family 4 protein [Rhodomicrobium]